MKRTLVALSAVLAATAALASEIAGKSALLRSRA